MTDGGSNESPSFVYGEGQTLRVTLVYQDYDFFFLTLFLNRDFLGFYQIIRYVHLY